MQARFFLTSFHRSTAFPFSCSALHHISFNPTGLKCDRSGFYPAFLISIVNAHVLHLETRKQFFFFWQYSGPARKSIQATTTAWYQASRQELWVMKCVVCHCAIIWPLQNPCNKGSYESTWLKAVLFSFLS